MLQDWYFNVLKVGIIMELIVSIFIGIFIFYAIVRVAVLSALKEYDDMNRRKK